MMINNSKLLEIAYEYAALNSDDPHTNTGAVLVDSYGGIVAIGANRLPYGVSKTAERISSEQKGIFMEHAERAVILKAARRGIATEGLTMVAPWAACADCARAIIGAGIYALIVDEFIMDRTPERWRGSIENAMTMLHEAGVEIVRHYDPAIRRGIKFDGVKIE